MSTNTVDITVEGMTCNGCAGKVRGALEALPGVATADVDHASGRVSVHTDGTVNSDDLEFDIDEAVAQTGYKVVAS